MSRRGGSLLAAVGASAGRALALAAMRRRLRTGRNSCALCVCPSDNFTAGSFAGERRHHLCPPLDAGAAGDDQGGLVRFNARRAAASPRAPARVRVHWWSATLRSRLTSTPSTDHAQARDGVLEPHMPHAVHALGRNLLVLSPPRPHKAGAATQPLLRGWTGAACRLLVCFGKGSSEHCCALLCL